MAFRALTATRQFASVSAETWPVPSMLFPDLGNHCLERLAIGREVRSRQQVVGNALLAEVGQADRDHVGGVLELDVLDELAVDGPGRPGDHLSVHVRGWSIRRAPR